METKVPDFTLKDVDGQEFNLYDRLGKAPMVLVFRRGSW
jgi:peroxiredoxin